MLTDEGRKVLNRALRQRLGAETIIQIEEASTMTSKTAKPAPAAAPKLTPRTLELFLEYARDAGNWSGTPLVGGNVGGSKEDRGNITQMKRAGLVTTATSDGNTYLEFTAAGARFAAEHGVIISDLPVRVLAELIEGAGHSVPKTYTEQAALVRTLFGTK